jgi:threonine dehydrogenase-like Zn-dependent dehydrogenase
MSGKLVLVGFHQGEPRRIPLGHWNWMAFDIVNAHYRDIAVIMRGMRVGMRLLSGGALSVGPLVTHRFPLEDIAMAFRTAIDRPHGFTKAMITFPRAPATGQAVARTTRGQGSTTVRPSPR